MLTRGNAAPSLRRETAARRIETAARPCAPPLLSGLLLLLGSCHLIFPFDSASRDGAGPWTDGPRPDRGAQADLADGSRDHKPLDLSPDAFPPKQVGTLAGVAYSPGYQDDPVATARFSKPAGIAVDGLGRVVVTEEGNHTIRVIHAGKVSTLAGKNGVCGKNDGQGTAATFCEPSGIILDGAGNLVVADYGKNLIRSIDPSGNVTTIAGNGSSASVDGAALQASFAKPQELALDPSTGAIYIVDFDGHKVRRLFNGQVTTVAGTGATGSTDGDAITAATFWYPAGLVVLPGSVVRIADSGNDAIRELASGTVSTLPLSYLAQPWDLVAVSASLTYFIEYSGNRLWSLQGSTASPVAGDGSSGHVDGALSSARFNGPHSVAFDGKGTLYVTDYRSHVVRWVRP